MRYKGLLEQYHVTRGVLGLDSCLISAANYPSKSGLELEKSTVYRVLTEVMETHPALCLRVHYENGARPYFSLLEKVDFDDVVRFVEGDHFVEDKFKNYKLVEDLMEEEFQKSFDLQQALPLWRLIVLSDNTILFMYSHGLGDGISGLAFHEAFLNGLLRDPPDNVKLERQTFWIPPTILKNLPDVVENLVNLKVPLSTLIPALIGTIVKRTDKRSWVGNTIQKKIDRNNRVRILTLSPEHTQAILAEARKQNSTLTGLLCISAVKSLQWQADKYLHGKARKVNIFIPVSLRKQANLTEATFGDFVSSITWTGSWTKKDRTNLMFDFEWHIASQISSYIRKSAVKAPARIGLLKYIKGKYEKYFMDKLGQEREAGIEVSNVGRFEPKISKATSATENTAEQEWKIGNTFFAQDNSVVGPVFNINVVGCPNGRLSICLTWGKDTVEDVFAEGMYECMKMKLHWMIRKPYDEKDDVIESWDNY